MHFLFAKHIKIHNNHITFAKSIGELKQMAELVFNTNVSVHVNRHLNSINDNIYYIDQVFGVIYVLIIIFFLVIATRDIFTQIRTRSKLLAHSYVYIYSDIRCYTYLLNERILRMGLALIFLSFELIYYLIINIYGFAYMLIEAKDNLIPIGVDCNLVSSTFLGNAYDSRGSAISLHVVSLLGDFSFSMMLWLFGASLLHLSFAARNELRVKTIFYFILFGLLNNIIIAAATFISYTSILGTIVQSLMDQISLIVVIYIAKKKFIPAMNSRVIDAYHLYNSYLYRHQKMLLVNYRIIIFLVLCTFELYILKDILFYNVYVIIESISLNSCWFNEMYDFPIFTIPHDVANILNQISYYCLIIVHLIDSIVYLNFISINLCYVITVGVVKICTHHKIRYHYRVHSSPELW